jgi:DNA replication protein DnaC
MKVLCTTAIAMSKQRIAAEADHARLKKLPHYATAALLGCDALGSLSLGHQGSPLFFQVISPRHQRKATVLTTTLPCAAWGKVFDSTTVATAIADRLVHNSEVLILGGTSDRRKLPSHHRRRTTPGKGARQGSPLAPNALFLSLDKRQQGPRAPP